MTAGDVVSAVLLPVGAAWCVLGALGLLRFPDLFTRLHAASKPQTIGVLCVLAGAAARMPNAAAIGSLVLTALFQLVTAPVVGHVIGAAAYRTEDLDRDNRMVDTPDGPR